MMTDLLLRGWKKYGQILAARQKFQSQVMSFFKVLKNWVKGRD